MNEVDDLLNFILSLLNIKTIDEDPQENQRQLAFIYKFIIDKFSFLTIEEIKEAFKMYVANQFEVKVFRMIDCVVVGEVLYSFIEHRNNILQNYTPIENTPKLEIITNSAKEEINKKAVNRVFNEFKEEKELPNGLTYIYDILVENGLIKVPNKNTPKLSLYYDKKMKEAQKEMISETKKAIERSKMRLDKSNLFSLKDTLNSIESNKDNSIILRAKRIILKEFFISRILDNQEKIF